MQCACKCTRTCRTCREYSVQVPCACSTRAAPSLSRARGTGCRRGTRASNRDPSRACPCTAASSAGARRWRARSVAGGSRAAARAAPRGRRATHHSERRRGRVSALVHWRSGASVYYSALWVHWCIGACTSASSRLSTLKQGAARQCGWRGASEAHSMWCPVPSTPATKTSTGPVVTVFATGGRR